MRKLLVLCLFALAAGALSAQTNSRGTTRPAATPNKNTTPASGLKPKSTLAPETTGKSTLQPGTNKQETGAQTRNTTTEPANTRTAAPSKTSLTTPKTVPAQMPAAPSIPQNEPQIQVQWMSLEEALEKSKTEKRKLFIDVFTDWCGWCKRMDQSTFVDPQVAQYLNENYYPVKFNAEQQQEIQFNNKTYHFRKNGARGYHELAAEWLNNRLSFPTVVFLDESMNLIQPIPGYLEAPKMEAILNYFGTDSHKTTPWETYEKKFSNSHDDQQR